MEANHPNRSLACTAWLDADHDIQAVNDGGRWIAFRIKSPGEGVLSITLEHAKNVNGAGAGRFVSGDAVVGDAGIQCPCPGDQSGVEQRLFADRADF